MAVIQSAEVLEKETCSWVYNESIKVKVKIKANEDCNDLQFEFMIRNIGSNQVIGKSESSKLGKWKKDAEYEFEFEIPTRDILAPGKYTAGMELWKIDEGIVTIYDIVPSVFDFEILDEDENDSTLKPLYWDNGWYGYMMLPEIKFNRIS